MWFKNLQIYRLMEKFEFNPETLHERLSERASRDCGRLELFTEGWGRPLGRHGSLLTHGAGGCIMICTRREEKVLPPSVIRDLVTEKAEAIEDAEARKVRRRERDEIRDNIVLELLPNALVKSSTTFAYIDTQHQLIFVDTASARRAEDLISLLRETLGTLSTRPVEPINPPVEVMTSWLDSNGLSGGFMVQDECELRDPLEEGGIVRCRRQDLEGEEIQGHLKAGKQVVRIALQWNDRLSFLLTEDLSVRRLKFLDILKEEADQIETDDAADRLDADFTLMTLEFGNLVPELFELFGGLNLAAGKPE
ncbi:MAG: recombination-associated protein RdgC [Gammaproteobacteria bacterium]|nr:recombination-associated protein RdgC [Gammaproteobacteria bacterium]